jgi:hypothetical protein
VGAFGSAICAWHPCDRESWADVGRVQAWADIANARWSLHGSRTPHKEGLTRCSRGILCSVDEWWSMHDRMGWHMMQYALEYPEARRRPRLRRDCMGPPLPTSTPGLHGPTPSHICAGTGARPRPHPRRDHAAHLGPSRRCTSKQTHRQQWRALWLPSSGGYFMDEGYRSTPSAGAGCHGGRALRALCKRVLRVLSVRAEPVPPGGAELLAARVREDRRTRHGEVGSPRPHLRRDRPPSAHICALTALAPPTSAPEAGSAPPASAPGPSSFLPHLRQDWSHPCHI